MSKMIILVTSHVEKGIEVAEAWEAAGAPGVTLIESHGLHRLRERSKSIELPFFVSMTQVMRQMEEHNQTIFSVVDDSLVDKLVNEACRVLGTESLDQEGAGVAFVLPVERVIGMRPSADDGE